MEYSMLNQEGSADLNLAAGDRLQVSLSQTEGTVNVTRAAGRKRADLPGKRTAKRRFYS